MDDIIGADTATATDAGCLDDETTTGNKYIGAAAGRARGPGRRRRHQSRLIRRRCPSDDGR